MNYLMWYFGLGVVYYLYAFMFVWRKSMTQMAMDPKHTPFQKLLGGLFLWSIWVVIMWGELLGDIKSDKRSEEDANAIKAASNWRKK
jgi:hypothetical protein